MEEEVKKISEEKLEYYRNNIEECPVDLLRVLYIEKEESEKYLYDAYQDAGKKMFEYAEELEDAKEYADEVWRDNQYLKEELEEKDMIIDNMADFIDEVDTKNLHCRGYICTVATTCYEEAERKRICRSCIKGIFKKSIKEV